MFSDLEVYGMMIATRDNAVRTMLKEALDEDGVVYKRLVYPGVLQERITLNRWEDDGGYVG